MADMFLPGDIYERVKDDTIGPRLLTSLCNKVNGTSMIHWITRDAITKNVTFLSWLHNPKFKRIATAGGRD